MRPAPAEKYSDSKPYEQLQLFWRESGSDIATRELSEAEVQELEQKYGIQFPDDFREYLHRSCPANEDAWDAVGTYWWPAGQIKNSLDFRYSIDGGIAVDPKKCIFFADFLHECSCWAIDCGEGANRGRVMIDGTRFVADDFAQFVELYVRDYFEDGNKVF